MKEQGAAEALTFTHHVFGWNVDRDVLTSRRISGAAIQSSLIRQSLGEARRSRPFPPEFLRYLEDLSHQVEG
eukprot:5427095-Amphidinium_carterae.2